ncbi:MAG: NADH-quinone oxidoreductase subunit C [Proteobacteria bacterium]|nr:NADH-quinone oxidoreductase subunit C [Pseudomonadota bacterium]MBU1685994.1 NADH-quinone oxidoreductase subunit C [Pseudomonadota bacterium]
MITRLKEKLSALNPISITETDHAAKGYHLDVAASPAQVVAMAEILDQEGFAIEAVTGVDWLGEAAAVAKKPEVAEGEEPVVETPGEPPEEQMEVVYDFSHSGIRPLLRIVIRCRINRGTPELPTISGVYPGANWHERETHDFFGIIFTGHPDLSPLLLPEDADFHPLLKDFKA